jgi:hypothetical protein
VLDVVGQVHRGHPARAELAVDDITVGQRGTEPLNGLGHCHDKAEDGSNVQCGRGLCQPPRRRGRHDGTRPAPAIAGLTRGPAYLEAYTSADDVAGDHGHFQRRSPAFYRKLFREAGFIPVEPLTSSK